MLAAVVLHAWFFLAAAAVPTAVPTSGVAQAPTTPPVAAPPVTAGPRIAPPRVDGTYVGGLVAPAVLLTRVSGLSTPDPFMGGHAEVRVGQVVLPFLLIGIRLLGQFGASPQTPRQRVGAGALMAEVGFVPVPRVPLLLRLGAGIGAGAVREVGVPGRSGFGGSVFAAHVRYEFFPRAETKRRTRAGGFAIGPELGWIGYTPAARDRPMANVFTLGLALTHYFGE